MDERGVNKHIGSASLTALGVFLVDLIGDEALVVILLPKRVLDLGVNKLIGSGPVEGGFDDSN